MTAAEAVRIIQAARSLAAASPPERRAGHLVGKLEKVEALIRERLIAPEVAR